MLYKVGYRKTSNKRPGVNRNTVLECQRLLETRRLLERWPRVPGFGYSYLIHDLLFLPISTTESTVS